MSKPSGLVSSVPFGRHEVRDVQLSWLAAVAACAAFGQTAGGSGITGGEVKAGLLAIGMAIASGLCGLGQGKAVASG